MKRIVALILVLAMVLLPGCRKADRYEKAIERGREFLLDEAFEEAIKAFWEAIKIDPKRPDAYKFRGDANMMAAEEALKKGDFEDADDYLDDAEDDYDRAEDLGYDDRKELDDRREELEILEERVENHDVGPGGRPQDMDGGKDPAGEISRKQLYRDFFYTQFNDNDIVVLADVTGDGQDEMMVVHLEDPDGFEITGRVYTVEDGAVREIYTNHGSSVHAGGFYGWYLVERDGGYCLGEEGFGMWQGVGVLSFTQYIPTGNGQRKVVEELILNSEDEGNHDEYGTVTEEAYFAYTDKLYGIMERSYCIYATASECGYSQWIETFPPTVFGTMDDAPPAMTTTSVGVEDTYVDIWESPFGGSDYCCHIPRFVMEDNRCEVMNEQIYQNLSRIMTQNTYNVEGYEGQPAVSVYYSKGENHGIASIVAQVTVQHSDYWYYRTYNMNTESGWEANDQEVIAACGYSPEEYRAALETAVSAYFENRFEGVLEYITQEEYDEMYVMTTCEETLRSARPFIDSQGRLCVVAEIGSFAGAGSYPYMVCLESADYTAQPGFLACPEHG